MIYSREENGICSRIRTTAHRGLIHRAVVTYLLKKTTMNTYDTYTVCGREGERRRKSCVICEKKTTPA